MQPDTRPLAGTRVIDLGWITAGAGTSSILADLGADVVKVEGPGSPDPFRLWEGAVPGTDWWNRCPYFGFTNRDKRSVCLDLRSERGQAVMHRLLEGADVLVENFRRGVMGSFGMSPAILRERHPRLVVASISSQGEDGPDRDMVSYGSTLEATGGLAALTGVDDAPVITGRDMNYPDQVVCLFASGAVVAALHERRLTGQGAHLDLSQRELTTFLLGEEMMAAAQGIAPVRRGNHDEMRPDEHLVETPEGWIVQGECGHVPVRDAAALVASREFREGTAILYAPDGRPAKGIPFRFSHRPLALREGCRDLGADNADVLMEAGFSLEDVASLLEAGIVATEPRKLDVLR